MWVEGTERDIASRQKLAIRGDLGFLAKAESFEQNNF
jgi:hypothetical protein